MSIPHRKWATGSFEAIRVCPAPQPTSRIRVQPLGIIGRILRGSLSDDAMRSSERWYASEALVPDLRHREVLTSGSLELISIVMTDQADELSYSCVCSKAIGFCMPAVASGPQAREKTAYIIFG